MSAISFYIILLLNMYSFTSQNNTQRGNPVALFNYDLSNPDKVYNLPNRLKEISGITALDASSVACIQDENGILYIYDLEKEKIKTEAPFFQNGDYEGITCIYETVYVLRSDGNLFKITGYETGDINISSIKTDIPSGNYEGLCYDSREGLLLLAPKGQVGKKSETKNKRYIYAYNLKSKKVDEKPAFIFDLKVINRFALENKIKVPMKNGKKGEKKEPNIEFNTSAIGINPVTGKLFMISGTERLLFVFNLSGNLEYMEKLDKELFNQPEGITFLKNGDLLISNESGNKKPTILRFNYLKK